MVDTLIAQIEKALDDNPRLIGSTLDAARKEIVKTIVPVVQQAIQQARDDAEAEITRLQLALEAWAARERAADRVRETISKKGGR